MNNEIKVTLNGDARALPSGLTVAGLLAHLGVLEARVAVERNREIVRKTQYDSTPIEPGDELEIVSFVGGG